MNLKDLDQKTAFCSSMISKRNARMSTPRMHWLKFALRAAEYCAPEYQNFTRQVGAPRLNIRMVKSMNSLLWCILSRYPGLSRQSHCKLVRLSSIPTPFSMNSSSSGNDHVPEFGPASSLWVMKVPLFALGTTYRIIRAIFGANPWPCGSECAWSSPVENHHGWTPYTSIQTWRYCGEIPNLLYHCSLCGPKRGTKGERPLANGKWRWYFRCAWSRVYKHGRLRIMSKASALALSHKVLTFSWRLPFFWCSMLFHEVTHAVSQNTPALGYQYVTVGFSW
jgi:hypothetical protein